MAISVDPDLDLHCLRRHMCWSAGLKRGSNVQSKLHGLQFEAHNKKTGLHLFSVIRLKLSTLEPLYYICSKLGSSPFQWVIFNVSLITPLQPQFYHFIYDKKNA